jgi:CMP/dCMP kinase
MPTVDLVTISREYGAGGSELAQALGRRLGWRVRDHDLPHAVAARLGVPDDMIEPLDEHVSTLLEQLGNSLLLGTPEVIVDPSYVAQPNANDVAAATDAILRESVTEPVVIVGHGAQALFHGRPGAFHVRLIAPLESRLARICARRNCGSGAAATLARQVDEERERYVKQLYGRDLRDPLLYDIQFNTGSITIEDAAAAIVRLIRGVQ